MKKNISIILASLMLLVSSGLALAGTDDIINLGTAQISNGELDRLKAMVAGDPVPAAKAPVKEVQVDLGVVELPKSDMNELRAMISGAYVTPKNVAAGEPMVDAGRVIMSRSEYESLKDIVSDHLKEVRSHIARLDLR